MRLGVAAAALLAAGIAAGILVEHYGATAAILDWSGLEHAIWIHKPRATHDRTEVSYDTRNAKRTMVVLAFGQSNAGNSGETPGAEHAAILEYYRGRLYRARDPLLGADGTGGSIWLRLAGKAIASGNYDKVILAPFAYSAAEIARWAPRGTLHNALISTIAEAQRNGLRFTHLLWQQGEADAKRDTSENEYREHFLAMLAAIRKLGVDAPIYVASASRCGKTRTSESVRRAQAALNNPAAGIYAGPDADALGFAERYDGCHFSTEGLEKAADLWWEIIRPRTGN